MLLNLDLKSLNVRKKPSHAASATPQNNVSQQYKLKRKLQKKNGCTLAACATFSHSDITLTAIVICNKRGYQRLLEAVLLTFANFCSW